MNIVITGASRGIGYHTSLLLSDQGHDVIAISRNNENLNKLKVESQNKNQSGKLFTIAGDVSDEKSLDKIKREIKSLFSQVNVLINNAGILINKPFDRLTSNDWSDVYSTNVFGAVNMIRSVLPLMSSGSHVVNMSSMGGFQGSVKFKGLSAYSSSKAALVNITECLAEELKVRRIAGHWPAGGH